MRALLLPVLAVLAVAGLAAAEPPLYELVVTEKKLEFRGQGDLLEGGTKSFRFPVHEENVTRVEMRLLWVDDERTVTRPDAFTLMGRWPQGAAIAGSPVSGTEGALFVEARDVNPMPAGGAVPPEVVSERLRAARGVAGRGEWTASVTLEDTGGPDALPLGGAEVDKGNAFTLLVILWTYEVSPTRVVSMTAPSPNLLSPVENPWGWSLGFLGASLAFFLGVVVREWRMRTRSLYPSRRDNTPSSDK